MVPNLLKAKVSNYVHEVLKKGIFFMRIQSIFVVLSSTNEFPVLRNVHVTNTRVTSKTRKQRFGELESATDPSDLLFF